MVIDTAEPCGGTRRSAQLAARCNPSHGVPCGHRSLPVQELLLLFLGALDCPQSRLATRQLRLCPVTEHQLTPLRTRDGIDDVKHLLVNLPPTACKVLRQLNTMGMS